MYNNYMDQTTYKNPNANYFNQAPMQPATQAQAPAIQPSNPVSSYTGNSIVDALNMGGQSSDFSSRTKLAQQYGIQNYSGTADQNTQLLQKYRQGFQQAQASNIPTPKTQGEGSSMVTAYTGGPTQMPSVNPVDMVMTQDKGYQDLLKLYSDYTNSNSQRESAVNEYLRFEKESGLEKINTDLINMGNVINGTEQDIRNEISAVGGFGTESQVQALAGARNKTLIQNYNNLLATKENAINRINTLTGLSAQDRQYAQQNFENQLQFQNQINQFRDKFVNNAKEAYNAIINQVGYGGLYDSLQSNPSELATVERTLGLAQGGLSQLSTYKKPLTAKEQLDLQKGQLEIKRLQQEIAGGSGGNSVFTGSNTPTLINQTTGKIDPLSQFSQIISNSKAKTDDKLKLTGAVLSAVQSFANKNSSGSIEGLGIGGILPGKVLSQKAQQNRTDLSALEGTIENWMTGAAVSEDQQKRIKKNMVPGKYDSDGQVKRKINALTNYMLNYASGSLATQGVQWTPETVDFFKPVIITSPDGQEWK